MQQQGEAAAAAEEARSCHPADDERRLGRQAAARTS